MGLKTEHSGAKHGNGAYWGRKVDAKHNSNKARRVKDRHQAHDKREEELDMIDQERRRAGLPARILGIRCNRPDTCGTARSHYEGASCTRVKEVK